MMKKNRTLWSNRLSKGNSKNFQRIGSSIHVDKRLYKEDILASTVHVKMLIKQRIIPKKDGLKIIKGLQKIKKEIEHKDSNCSALDRLSVQIDYQNKLKSGKYDVEYLVIDKGRERNYIFKLVESETIDTIFGQTETVVIKRIIQGNKRSTLTWYAINHDFVPVKIEQYRKTTLKFTAYLTNYLNNFSD